ncbi:MAG: hypothetical protein ACYCO3_06035 [Mycobacteriales bacterium]
MRDIALPARLRVPTARTGGAEALAGGAEAFAGGAEAFAGGAEASLTSGSGGGAN